MNNMFNFLGFIKNLVYKIVLPIYLWSIGFKSLEDYITELEQDYLNSKPSGVLKAITKDYFEYDFCKDCMYEQSKPKHCNKGCLESIIKNWNKLPNAILKDGQ